MPYTGTNRQYPPASGYTGTGGVQSGRFNVTMPKSRWANRGSGGGAPPPATPGDQGQPPPMYPGGQPPPWTPTSAPGYQEDYYTRNAYKWEQPSRTSQYWAGQSGFFNGPQQGENTLNDISQRMGTPGQGERTMQDNVSRFNDRGDFENWFSKNSSKLDGASPLELMQSKIMGEIDSARNQEGFWGQAKGQLNDSYTEKMARGYQDTPSFSENFLTGGGATEGLDKLYGRLGETGGRNLDQAAAARGGFNSGAALRNRQNLEKDLQAQYVNHYQSAAGQADQAKIARLGEGRALMQGADSSLRGRLETGFQGAMGTDSVALNRASSLQSLGQALGGETRANMSLAGNLAGQSQQFGDQRLRNLMDYSERGDRLGMDRETLRGNTAERGQNLGMTRIMQGLEGSGRVEQDDLFRLSGGQTAAGAADGARETRLGNMFNRTLNLGGAQAGAHQSGMDAIRRDQLQLQLSQIDGMLKRGEISAAERDARRAEIMQMMSMPLSVYRPGGGAPAPAPAPKTPSALPPGMNHWDF